MKGLGKIAGCCLRGVAVLVAAGSLLLSGCVKEDTGACWQQGGPDGDVTVGWRPGTLTVAGAPSGGNGGWDVFGSRGVSGAATRADVPPAPESGPVVDNPDDLSVGTTFRVLVYEAGADPQTDRPVSQNTYLVADAKGTIVATAVDDRGNVTDGDTHEIVLRRGAYDFYYFSPAVAASTVMPNPGTYTGLTNGVDYMALAQRQVIDPSQGPKHYIPEVCFYRMGSYLDVRISPREGEIMGTLEVSGEGLQLSGLPEWGSYEVGGYPYRLATEGTGGLVEFSPAHFAAEEGAVATVSTIGCGGGMAVLPGYVEELKVKVTLTSDGKEMKLDATLPGYVFEPGYRYVVELGVCRIADKPQLTIEILPWDGHDWGAVVIDGMIGTYYGGGVIYWVNPDDANDFRVVELGVSEPLQWAASGSYQLGSVNESYTAFNGAEVMALAKAYSDAKTNGATGNFATDFPAFSYCYEKTDGGVAKGTWFVPSRAELQNIYYHKSIVNYVLPRYGGTSLYNADYWGTTEWNSDRNQATRLWMGDGYTGMRDKASTQLHVRCVRRASTVGNLYGGGVVYWVNPDDARDFRVVALDEPSKLMWAASNNYVLGVGAQDQTVRNGADVWKMAKSYSDNKTGGATGNFATDFPAFSYCYEKTDGGVPKGTWYLPSLHELQDLYDAKGTVSPVITANGGTAFDTYGYRSATEFSSNNIHAWVVSFAEGVVFEHNKTYTKGIRCVRDSRELEPYVSFAAVNPATGDIPGGGATYGVTLTGTLPSEGVEVRASSGGTALVSGKVTASGTPVNLSIPANTTGAARTVMFEYKWKGTWTKIGAKCSQACIAVTKATHNAPSAIPGQGGTYSVTLEGTFPAGGVTVHAATGNTVLDEGKVTSSGQSVQLKVPANMSYSGRTIKFTYNLTGSDWPVIGNTSNQKGYHVDQVSHNAPSTIPGGEGTYTVTLKGWGDYAVRAVITGTETVVGSNMSVNDDPSKTEVTKELTVSANTGSGPRSVTFQYRFNNVWTKIGSDCSQKILSVGDLYGGGVVYWVNPDDANDFRVVAMDEVLSKLTWAASKDYVLGVGAQDKTVRNGADVWKIAKSYSDNKTGGATGNFATDFPAFSYCYEKTDGGVPKGTWYLPSIQELRDLYSAAETVEPVIKTNDGQAFTVNGYWAATASANGAWYAMFTSTWYESEWGNPTYDGNATRCIRRE